MWSIIIVFRVTGIIISVKLWTVDYPTGLSDEQKEDYENTFFEKVTFENIVDIYRFDTKLRSLCLDALEKIEIACGGALCEHMCTKYGGYWFTNAEHVKNIFVEKNKTDDFGNFIFNEKGKKVKEKVRIWGMDFLQEHFDKLIEENKKNAMYCSFQAKIQQ